jgi:RHS repeat-associated protein
MAATSRQVVNAGSLETTFYIYGAGGQRARKITERQNGMRKNERFYLGEFELYREYGSGTALGLERETLHVMDDKQRVALVETKTIENGAASASPAPVPRYQLANHLGSASLELDEAGGLISYEEYSPYGVTTFQAGRSAAEISLKRYRYTGKERDQENGFTYYGARYYAPWLGRWASCDHKAKINLFDYCSGDPLMRLDPDGRDDRPREAYQAEVTGHETPEQVRAMFAARGIFYNGDATWIKNDRGGGYWYIGDSQVQARDTGTQLNMRADQITASSGTSKPSSKVDGKSKPIPFATTQEQWQVAQQSARNWFLDRAIQGASPILPSTIEKALARLRAPEPPAHPSNLRDYELRESYDAMQRALTTVEIAGTIVAGPIAESAGAVGGTSRVATAARLEGEGAAVNAARLEGEGAAAGSGGTSGTGLGPNGPRVHSRYADQTPAFEGQQPPRIKGPEPTAEGPHSVLRHDTVNNRTYQAREYDAAGNPVRDIDFTNPTYPNGTPRPGRPGPPHQHRFEG